LLELKAEDFDEALRIAIGTQFRLTGMKWMGQHLFEIVYPSTQGELRK
jgi:hypothetical protein